MARAIDFFYSDGGGDSDNFVFDSFVQNSLHEKFFGALVAGGQRRTFTRRIAGEYSLVIFAGQIFDAIFTVDVEYFYQRKRTFLVDGVADSWFVIYAQ